MDNAAIYTVQGMEFVTYIRVEIFNGLQGFFFFERLRFQHGQKIHILVECSFLFTYWFQTQCKFKSDGGGLMSKTGEPD